MTIKKRRHQDAIFYPFVMDLGAYVVDLGAYGPALEVCKAQQALREGGSNYFVDVFCYIGLKFWGLDSSFIIHLKIKKKHRSASNTKISSNHQ